MLLCEEPAAGRGRNAGLPLRGFGRKAGGKRAEWAARAPPPPNFYHVLHDDISHYGQPRGGPSDPSAQKKSWWWFVQRRRFCLFFKKRIFCLFTLKPGIVCAYFEANVNFIRYIFLSLMQCVLVYTGA